MDKRVLYFLQSQRICVLAVTMPGGTPHGATLHVAFNPKTNQFYFSTDPKYMKAQALEPGTSTTATIVIGTDEREMKTFQADGVASRVSAEDIALVSEIYLNKFPEKQGKFLNNFYFAFTPRWWRFTDWTTPQGKQIISSTDN